jgi:DNA repair photolyase
MNKKMKGAAYYRDMDATRLLPYKDKFTGLLRLCAKAKKNGWQVLIVASPEILGDDYEELVTNLRQAAKAGMMVAFAKDANAGFEQAV